MMSIIYLTLKWKIKHIVLNTKVKDHVNPRRYVSDNE